MPNFKHRPSLGDVIYSLPVVRELGGGNLYLDPRIHGGNQDPYWELPSTDDSLYENIRVWGKRFPLLVPLLEQQDYINKVKLYEGEPIDYDLDWYYIYHMGGTRDVTIVDAHYIGFAHYGMDLKSPKPTKPWLSLKRNSIKERGEAKPIVFADTGTWGAGPGHWADLEFVKTLPNDQFYNCTSHRPPCANVGTPRFPQNLLEWAELIDACDLFIGNQSFPLSLAVGFGKTRMFIECQPFPNCTFGHENEHYISPHHAENMEMLRRLSPVPVMG